MNVIGYARVVPDAEAEAALAHQKQRIEQFCRMRGLNLLQVFTEEMSGDMPLPSRTTLNQALDSTAQNGAQGLVLVRLNKLSANTAILKEIVQAAKTKNLELIPIDGPKSADEMRSSLQITGARPQD